MAPSGTHAPHTLWQSYSENNVPRVPQRTLQMLQTPENWVSHLFQNERNKEKNLSFLNVGILMLVMEAMSKESWKTKNKCRICIISWLHSPWHAKSKRLLSWPMFPSHGTLTASCSLASTLQFHYSCKYNLLFCLSSPLLCAASVPRPSVSPDSYLALWLTIWFSLAPSSSLRVVPEPLHFFSAVYSLES